MKKNDWILLISVLSYSVLLYQQFAGINMFILNMIILAGLFWKNKSIWKQQSVRIPIAGTLASAVCILLYGDGLSVFANICSLSILGSVSANPDHSVITSLIFSAYSYFSAPFFMVRDAIKRMRGCRESGGKGFGLVLYLIPLLIFFLFVILYRNSSSLFENLTNRIHLDFIEVRWIFFTLGGLILLYGFYYGKRFYLLSDLEGRQKNLIERSGSGRNVFMGLSFDLLSEQKSGVILLGALNVLIGIVNLLDLNFLILGNELPAGMTYSEMVHQGIGSLILSIMVAVAIILWYFKGELNFVPDSMLRTLAVIWIFQNLFMVGSNVYKNFLYTEEFLLTYKRIGVFIYLLMATIGLLTTAYKLKNRMSAWFLFKQNIIAAYLLLIVCCFANWDLWIARYNIRQSASRHKMLDATYLASLSVKVIPDLYRWMFYHKGDPEYSTIKPEMERKIFQYLSDQSRVDWRSWSHERQRISLAIDSLFKEHLVDSINIKSHQRVPYPEYVQDLTINNHDATDILWINELSVFTNLRKLNISGTLVRSLQGLPVFSDLEILNISYNKVRVLTPATCNPNLVTLIAAGNDLTFLPDMSNLHQLRELDVSDNRISSLETLATLDKLEFLNISHNAVNDFSFIVRCPHLKTLIVSPMKGLQIQELREKYPNLEILVTND